MNYRGPATLLRRADGKTVIGGEADLSGDVSKPGRVWSGTLTFREGDETSLVQPLGDHYALRLDGLDDAPRVDTVVRHQDGSNNEVVHLTGDSPLLDRPQPDKEADSDGSAN